MAEAVDFKAIGTRPVRPDGIDKVTGRAAFGADLNLPNMLHGKVLRSPYAHARVKSVDLSRARAADGVLAAVSGADFPGEGVSDLGKNVMARDKVLYHGHAVAAVAAKTLQQAEAALDLIDVEYEVLEPVLSLDQAMAEGATLVNETQHTNGDASKPASNVAATQRFERGDIDAGFAEADVIVESEHRVPTAHQGYIEPHACTATVNEDGKATVWCCTQGHFDVRSMTAQVLGQSVGNIKVIPSEIGGGFGGKTIVYLEPLAVKMSQMAGRPVKMTMSREEVFRATGPTSATWCKVKIGARNDGTFTAAQAWLAYEAGAFPGAPIGPGCMSVLAPYEVPNLVIEGNDVLVNKPKVCAYRAPGAPQSMHAMECAIDELARKLDMDPIDLRLKNAAAEGTVAPYGPRFPAIGLRACLEAAKEHANYKAPVPEGAGRGLAVGFWFNIGMQSSAEVRIAEDGAVTVMEGSPDIGGSRASMALMAAETLGVPYEKVKAHVGDTESTGFCNVTGGSRTTFATGMAVIQACEDIIAQCRQRAALTWDLDEDQVDWADGEAVPKPGVNADVKPLSLANIARGAGRTGGPLLGRASLNAQGAGASFSCNFTDAKVDKETGKVDILSFTAVQDAGRAIHPSYVEGQMQGGAVQGLGWALNEEYIYDADGVMENAGFLDYRVPVASDMPMIDTQIIEVPNPFHPYGVRGVGETPIVAPLAALSNAVRDQLGFRIDDLPLSPPRVLEAIDEQGGASSSPSDPPGRRHRFGSSGSYAALALAASWVLSAGVSEAQTEGHGACEALEENTICRGICEHWQQSPDPWNDAELVSRAGDCWNNDERWEDYTPVEEVVVTGTPVPEPAPVPTPTTVVCPHTGLVVSRPEDCPGLSSGGGGGGCADAGSNGQAFSNDCGTDDPDADARDAPEVDASELPSGASERSTVPPSGKQQSPLPRADAIRLEPPNTSGHTRGSA